MATEADFRALHLLELGAVLAGAPAQDVNTTALMVGLEGAMAAVWNIARTKATVPGTLPWYAKREAIDVLLGQLRAVIDANLGPLDLKQSHLFRNLMEMRKAAQEEIVRLETRAAISYRPAVGETAVKAPREVTEATVTVTETDGVRVAEVERTAEVPDPNWPGWGGSPIDRPLRGPDARP